MIDLAEREKEAAAIRADMQKAYRIIQDAKLRYIKAKLRAKSKKQAADAAVLFADLADYGSKQEIQDYYGGGWISDTERERLMNLWDAREQHAKDGAMYRDRVIDMLDKAVAHIGDEYQDFLFDTEQMIKDWNRGM